MQKYSKAERQNGVVLQALSTLRASTNPRIRIHNVFFFSSFFLLAYSIYKFLFHSYSTKFPYGIYVPLLVISFLTQVTLWLPQYSRAWRSSNRVRIVTLTMLGSLISVTFSGWVWAQTMVSEFANRQKAVYSNNYVPLSKVSLVFQDATIAMEDQDFFDHGGLDFVAIHRALRMNISYGRIVQGGSTITQQLAKNLFLSQDRTVVRKVKEALLTLALEQHFTKLQILELYVNKIDYGMGQHGIFNASDFYFHEKPDKLALAQSALLVGLVPRPPRYCIDESSLRKGKETALARIASLYEGRYTDTQINAASNIPLKTLISGHVSPNK